MLQNDYICFKTSSKVPDITFFYKDFNVFVLLAQQPFEVVSSIHEMGHQMEIALLLSSKTLEIFLSWERQHRGEYAMDT